MNAVLPVVKIDYIGSARRHLKDAQLLLGAGREANAGQLLGFSVECGLKALLIACGMPIDPDGRITPDPDGGIPAGHKFYTHLPQLNDRIVSNGGLVTDGQRSAHYRAMLPSIGNFSDWSVAHRYFREASLPLVSVNRWNKAAEEMNEMLDMAIADGVM